MADVKLKQKAKKYYDLYTKIKKQKASGNWDTKRESLTGPSSMGTNEYSDLFNILDSFYDQAQEVFDSISDLDSLTDAQIESLNSSVLGINVDKKDIETAILRANGAVGALSMTMQVLDAEEGLVEAKKQLLSSGLATSIKVDMLTRIDELSSRIDGFAKTIKSDMAKSLNRAVDDKLDQFYSYISDTVFDQVYSIPEQVSALVSKDVVEALSAKDATETLNSSLFQPIHNSIGNVREAVEKLQELLKAPVTSAEVATKAAEIVATLTEESQRLSNAEIKELKRAYGKGIEVLVAKINDSTKTSSDMLTEVNAKIENLAKGDLEIIGRLDDIKSTLDGMSTSGDKDSKDSKKSHTLAKVVTGVTIATLAISTATLAVVCAIKANQQPVIDNNTSAQVYVLSDDEMAAMQFGGVEFDEYNSFLRGLSAVPANVSTTTYLVSKTSTSGEEVDPYLGYKLEGEIITSSDGSKFEISTLNGKKAFANDLEKTFNEYNNVQNLDKTAIASAFMDAASLDDWNSTSTWGGSMYESYNSTGAMKSLYDLTQNREAHSQEEMNDLQNAADLYNALADVLKGMGYDPTGHSADEIKDYIVQYGSDEAINNLYTEMTNAGKVSGQATTTADKRAEIAGVTIESHTDADLEKHTDADLEKHTDADLEKHTPEQSALYDALADALTKMGYDPTGHSADEIKDFITKYGSDATINSLYEEMAQAGKVSGKAATSADKRAEIAGVTIESHTDADLEQHSKEQIEALQNAAEAYDALRGALEGHYNGDASGLTDEQLLLEVLQNANMGEYEAVCNEVFAAYEQVFGQGSSKGKDVSTCLQEMVQKIVDLSKNIGTEEFKQAVVAVYKSFGMRYDNSKTPEENWNNLCKVMGWDAELESGNVDQDTPNPNFKERGE